MDFLRHFERKDLYGGISAGSQPTAVGLQVTIAKCLRCGSVVIGPPSIVLESTNEGLGGLLEHSAITKETEPFIGKLPTKELPSRDVHVWACLDCWERNPTHADA